MVVIEKRFKNQMKILLATDGSEYSKRAAEFLTCLNLSSEDEIAVFHAVYWIPFLYNTESYYDTFKEIKEEIAPRIIDSALEILKPVHARISTFILDGSPEQCIMDVAAKSDVDLIVMGARGIKGIESLFVGSVTRSVAIKSPKPVLVTKLLVCERPDKMKILFATDGSEYSIATGEFLTGIPFPDNTEITILNVMPSEFLDIPETFVPKINERITELMQRTTSHAFIASQRINDRARESLGKRFKNINVLSEIGDAPSEILKTAERLKTDVIAVGCRGLRGIKGMMGSVSRNVLTHSKCAVLIGKACEP
jgi:nucleotide-binding universal stress UspA family protein